MLRNWTPTYTKRRWCIDEPRVDDIDVADIAHSLASFPRWGAQSRTFYSIAEHSVRVSWLVEKLARRQGIPRDQVTTWAAIGLMHDAAEAYPPFDIVAPLKDHLRAAGQTYLLELQHGVDMLIRRRFELPDIFDAPLLSEADDIMLWAEWVDVMDEQPLEHHRDRKLVRTIHPWDRDRARLRFLLRFKELFPRHSVSSAVDMLMPVDLGTDPRESTYENEHTLLLKLVLLEAESKR